MKEEKPNVYCETKGWKWVIGIQRAELKWKLQKCSPGQDGVSFGKEHTRVLYPSPMPRETWRGKITITGKVNIYTVWRNELQNKTVQGCDILHLEKNREIAVCRPVLFHGGIQRIHSKKIFKGQCVSGPWINYFQFNRLSFFLQLQLF